MDIAAGSILAAISLVTLSWVVPANVGVNAAAYDVTPTFFPKLAAGSVLALSLILVAARLMTGEGPLSERLRARGGLRVLGETGLWLLVSAFAHLAISRVGFPVTAALLMVAIAFLCRYRLNWIVGLLAIGFPLIVDQLAWLLFVVDLP